MTQQRLYYHTRGDLFLSNNENVGSRSETPPPFTREWLVEVITNTLLNMVFIVQTRGDYEQMSRRASYSKK